MLLESFLEGVVARLEVRNAWRRRAAEPSSALEFLISDVVRRVPGSTVHVLLVDGDDALHADLAAVTKQIMDVKGVRR